MKKCRHPMGGGTLPFCLLSGALAGPVALVVGRLGWVVVVGIVTVRVGGAEAAVKVDEASALQGEYALVAFGEQAKLSWWNLNLRTVAAAELEGDVVAAAAVMVAVMVMRAAMRPLGDNERLGGDLGLTVVVRPLLEAFSDCEQDRDEDGEEGNWEN